MTKKIKRVDSRRVDLAGQTFGDLTVIKLSDRRGHGNTLLWECKCTCGNTIYVQGYSLIHGHYKSCGCKRDEKRDQAVKKHIENDKVDGTRKSALNTKVYKNNKSGVKGVRYNEQRKKWTAHIGFKGKQINLGYYEDKKDAIKARKQAEEKYHKPILENKKERKKLDMLGERYGKLTVVKEVEKKHNKRRFICKCECGNEIVAYMGNLRSGTTRSCGCLQAEKASDMALDLTGQKRGMLTAYKNTGKTKYGSYVWLFKCDCGCMTKMTTSEFGNIQSCGCLRNNKDQEIIEYNGYKWLASNVRVSQEDFEDI